MDQTFNEKNPDFLRNVKGIVLVCVCVCVCVGVGVCERERITSGWNLQAGPQGGAATDWGRVKLQ